MLCEKCGKYEATTHIKTVINGVIKEVHLCQNCSNKEGFVQLSVNPLSQMLTSLFGDSNSPIGTETKRCFCCGATLSDIRESGKVGCFKCYDTFLDELLPYIKRIHGSTVHNGKTINNESVKPKEDTVSELKKELKRLIEEENFEAAAVVRDKIKEAEGKV